MPSHDHPLDGRFAAFVAERDPHALTAAQEAFRAACPVLPGARDAAAIEALRPAVRRALAVRLPGVPAGVPDTTPRVPAAERVAAAAQSLIEACDGFLRRESLAASLSADERREILRGMVLTRAVDNRLKSLFTGGEVQYAGAGFQGKGFRSLGQEAIYAAPL